MSTYQLTCWSLEDFDHPDQLFGVQNVGHSDAALRKSVSLNGCAEEYAIQLSNTDPTANNHYHVCLAEDLAIGDQVFPTGSRLIPETVLHIENPGNAMLIVGRIATANAQFPDPGFPIVFANTRLTPGQPLPISKAETAPNDGPGTNCFARGTLIETPHGALPIEQLEDGDEVMGQDGRLQMISWIGRRRLSGLELVLNPKLRPVRIMAGALTGGRPGQDLIVSQDHRLLVDDWRAPYLFGEDEILVPARSLLNDTNVTIDCPLGGIDYFHLLMDGHSMVCANGLWAETMLPEGTASECRPVLPALPHQSARSFAA